VGGRFEVVLEGLELAHRDIVGLCGAQEDVARQAGKAKWLDSDMTEEVEREFGDKIREGEIITAVRRIFRLPSH